MKYYYSFVFCIIFLFFHTNNFAQNIQGCEQDGAIIAYYTAKNYFLEKKYVFAIEASLSAKEDCPNFVENNELIAKIEVKLDFFEKNNLFKDSLDFDFITFDELGNKNKHLLDTATRAMMYKKGEFFLVDKSGNELKKYGKWANILDENYFEFGFILAENQKKQRFLITDTGEKLVYEDDISQITSQTQALDLSNEDLERLPTEIFYLPNLLLLNISGTNSYEIPQSVKNLKNLKYLITSNNPLKDLPQEIKELEKLELLDISICPFLEKLPPFIASLSKLRFLDISMTKITDIFELKNKKELKIIE